MNIIEFCELLLVIIIIAITVIAIIVTMGSMWSSGSLTLWRLLLPYGYSYKASCARPG